MRRHGQRSLFRAEHVTPPEGIDLRCCDVAELLREVRGARLVHADPPWRYSQEAGVANPETYGIYAGLSEAQIVEHLDAAYDCAGPSARMSCWYTWPKDAEWSTAGGAGKRWGARTSGGSWTKMLATDDGAMLSGPHPLGVGYHWRGQCEPVALFTKGATGRPPSVLLNAHVSPSGSHSEKPLAWLREWLRAWTDPGDLVLDLYAGLAPMARACKLEGRRYVGAEIDPDRHLEALLLLRNAR